MSVAAKLAAAIGKGLIAGLAGTAAMTASTTIEARLRRASRVPRRRVPWPGCSVSPHSPMR